MHQRRCYGCMNTVSGPVCSCGYPENGNNEPHQLPVGTVLRGQYIVGKVLGQGGFGITYLGWDNYLDIPVAIKEYYPSAMVNRECALSTHVHCYTEQMRPQFEASKARFLREAKALAKFSDEPAIVQIKGFFEEHGTAYIIMEYVKGTTLAQYVKIRGGRLPVEETFRILKPVMEALSSVHQAGLVHRDIAPDNIMLHPRGGAKLLDFGAVRSVDGSNPEAIAKSTEAILKHGFAPIEQYQTRGNLGPWTDVYGLCGTVYYCLTGKVPEEAISRLTEDTDLAWDEIPGLSESRREALESGTAVHARNRTASVAELMKGLYNEQIKSEDQLEQELRRKITAELTEELTAKITQQLTGELTETISRQLEEKYRSQLSQGTKHSSAGFRKFGKKLIIPVAALLAAVVAVGLFLGLGRSTGFKKEGGATHYYITPSEMVKGAFLKLDGDTYYFDSNGDMGTGWYILDGNRYFFDENGRMVAGCLLNHEGSTYYLGSDGVMRTGSWTLDGKDYHFGEDGKLQE